MEGNTDENGSSRCSACVQNKCTSGCKKPSLLKTHTLRLYKYILQEQNCCQKTFKLKLIYILLYISRIWANCSLATYLICFGSWRLMKDDQHQIMSRSSYVSSSGRCLIAFQFSNISKHLHRKSSQISEWKHYIQSLLADYRIHSWSNHHTTWSHWRKSNNNKNTSANNQSTSCISFLI